ncbi:hypothetical protein SEA_MUFASA8_52 [Arthrobacter phage Mufasa8]|uniref:Uncharacterized protein n=1 Tax=Arthrobacter phage Mufasa8 TaxID=2656526 RepID=A0A649VM50_9CAUD|nr:hypothetical protein HYQ08_gp052 [Arthrobacter phage Mufasa8]QGJ93500.1 hypothetical protein SEA_MUFASA8_52 [Arthrobacter phage Mufasa8]
MEAMKSTLSSQNPLNRRLPTPDEYARAHRAFQSKAAFLLKDLSERQEKELTAVRAKLDAEGAKLEAGIAEQRKRNASLRVAERRAMRARDRAEESILTLQREAEDLTAIHDLRLEQAQHVVEARKALERLYDELAERKQEAAKLADKIRAVNRTIARRQAKVDEAVKYRPLTDDERRVVEADMEIARHSRRKAAERAEAADVALAA